MLVVKLKGSVLNDATHPMGNISCLLEIMTYNAFLPNKSLSKFRLVFK